MEVSEPSESTNSPSAARPKRSRTGCLTCRTRRRKCDENKPKCQNCLSKGFECRYAATFQILGKNNYTAEVESSVKYGKVRFVSDDGDQPAMEDADRRPVITGRYTENSPSLSSPAVSIPLRAEKSLTRTESQSRPAELQHAASHTPSPNSYAFALHGLLALGSGNGASDGLTFSPIEESREQPVMSVFDNVDPSGIHTAPSSKEVGDERTGHTEVGDVWQSTSPILTQLDVNAYGRVATAESPYAPTPGSGLNSVKHDITKVGSTSGASTHRTRISDISTSGWVITPDAVSTDVALELLKHYRYHIAPWLDICDSNQCFGVEVLALSAETSNFRYGVLALADASLHRTRMSQMQETADNNRETIAEQDVIQCAILDVFRILRDATTDLASFWRREEEAGDGRKILETLLPQLSSDSTLASCAYWLLVRLVMGCALMASTPVRISLPFVAENLFRSAGNGSIPRCAQDAMALCVDAIMFSQGDEDRWLQQRYGLNRVEVWKTLIQGFVHWYKHRPQEFQPIIELYPKDGVRSDNDFPTIVFTGGAAILANQLYHTGMLLLLQNKPRFAEKPNSNSSSMSTLWYV
ncbi:Nn.00g010070.m01.CDS01 [Neocucurbitaria sp. VM-36]